MTTNDIDAIRNDLDMRQQFIDLDRPVPTSTLKAVAAGAAQLLAEVEQLRETVADRNASLDRVIAERDALTEAQDRAAKRIDGLRDYILGSLDEDLPLVAEELRNASIDLADALADLGHPVTGEVETPRRPVVTVELPAENAEATR